MQEVERVASVSPGSELNMSGILMQEESFESDEEDGKSRHEHVSSSFLAFSLFLLFFFRRFAV